MLIKKGVDLSHVQTSSKLANMVKIMAAVNDLKMYEQVDLMLKFWIKNNPEMQKKLENLCEFES